MAHMNKHVVHYYIAGEKRKFTTLALGKGEAAWECTNKHPQAEVSSVEQLTFHGSDVEGEDPTYIDFNDL